MDPRFVTRNIHAALDYPVAIVLMVAPFALQLGQSHPAARWLAVATGVAALVLTVFTNHRLGVVRVLPYAFHLTVDALVGVTFVAAPFLLGFSGPDAWFYWANGAAVLTVVGLSRPESTTAEAAPA